MKKFNLDADMCCFIGDQDTDIKCGKTMGMRTVKINNKHSIKKSGSEKPDGFAANLLEAVHVTSNL